MNSCMTCTLSVRMCVRVCVCILRHAWIDVYHAPCHPVSEGGLCMQTTAFVMIQPVQLYYIRFFAVINFTWLLASNHGSQD